MYRGQNACLEWTTAFAVVIQDALTESGDLPEVVAIHTQDCERSMLLCARGCSFRYQHDILTSICISLVFHPNAAPADGVNTNTRIGNCTNYRYQNQRLR